MWGYCRVSADNIVDNLNFPVLEWFPKQTQEGVQPSTHNSVKENSALKNAKFQYQCKRKFISFIFAGFSS